MPSYIKRETAIALFTYEHGEYIPETLDDGSPNVLAIKDVKAVLRGAPSADVAPVVHGRWAIVEYEFFTCSVCGKSYYNGAESTAQAESYLNSGHVFPYCPHCGAKMDLKG